MFLRNPGDIMKRKLPKLMACMDKTSLDNMRNRAMFGIHLLDANGLRRRQLDLHECLILELRESGFNESSDYLQDLIYDNIQLVAEDEIGVVVDLRQRQDYLEHICQGLKKAEKQRDRANTKEECLELMSLAMYYAEKGKGILWLAEKFFLAAIAVSSQYMVDGGRQKACCKYHYGKFLLDKFPGADTQEAYHIFTAVRDSSVGKTWPLEEPRDGQPPSETVFFASAIQLHRVLLAKSREIRKKDPGKAERLARLAERRARDANEKTKLAEAIVEMGICQLMMNNLNNSQKTLEKAYKIYFESDNLEGICDTKMHIAAVMQRLGDHETAAKLLTEMGTLAMKNGFRRHLGRALHLLGELHLRREKPELGTQHLAEAFTCFMGFGFANDPSVQLFGDTIENLDVIYTASKNEIYEEEAEQSRLMMSISAGQEKMASYFGLLRVANGCSVAQIQVIEWKLQRAGWWTKRLHHDYVPCMCPEHHRTPLDVLRIKLDRLVASPSIVEYEHSTASAMLKRINDYPDIRFLRSSLHHTISKEHVKEPVKEPVKETVKERRHTNLAFKSSNKLQ